MGDNVFFKSFNIGMKKYMFQFLLWHFYTPMTRVKSTKIKYQKINNIYKSYLKIESIKQ